MRVNVYAEEMTDRIEIISKEIDGHTFTGLRFYLHLPTTIPCRTCGGEGVVLSSTSAARCSVCGGTGTENVQGPFMHRPGDDDSAAVTFWGKRDLRDVLRLASQRLDEHYGDGGAEPVESQAAHHSQASDGEHWGAEVENESLRAENQRLRERIAALEARPTVVVSDTVDTINM